MYKNTQQLSKYFAIFQSLKQFTKNTLKTIRAMDHELAMMIEGRGVNIR